MASAEATSAEATNVRPKIRTQTDDYTCGLIVGRFQAGQKIAEIQRDMGIPRSTVVDCVNRWKKTGTGTIEKRQGRPLKRTEK